MEDIETLVEKHYFYIFCISYAISICYKFLIKTVELYNLICVAILYNMYGFIDPGQISVHFGSVGTRIDLIAKRLERCYVDQLFLTPYKGKYYF